MTMAANPSDDVFHPFVAPPAESKDDPRGFATDLEEFDPFQIGASTETKSPRATSKKSPDRKVASNGGSSPSKASTKLAPRLDVKFMVHEEVTSVSDPNGENEGSSEVFVEGTVQVSWNIIETCGLYMVSERFIETLSLRPSTQIAGSSHIIRCIEKFSVHFVSH